MGNCPTWQSFYEKIPDEENIQRSNSSWKPFGERSQKTSRIQGAAGEKMWINDVVPYILHRSLDYNKDRILMAMRTIETYSRFRFKERTSEKTYLSITKSKGCYFYEDGVGHRKVSLDIGAEDFGTVLHELLHAIGFPHEHRRPDRDKYIIIHWENIMNGMENQFKKLNPNEYKWSELPFDYQSIMMYGSYAFSKNEKVTIESRDGRTIYGNRIGLSKLDKEKLRMM